LVVQLPVDPRDKGRRPVVVIVSLDARNRHERANAVLVVPPTHTFLPAGETGLQLDSAARGEDVTVVRKRSLIEPQTRLRQIAGQRVCELASKVNIAMGCRP
jgi:mRNA-degrading endonuclease toxin of MazEF toxin-antitoxin module